MGKRHIIFLSSILTVLAVQGGEITPINAIASSLASNDNISNIIDKRPDSLACTGQEKHPWVQVNLEKVYCIAKVQVKRLYGICNFTVSENNSTIESTEDCGRLQLKVFNRSAAPQNQLTTYQSQPKLGCLLGDSVKVARKMQGSICVKELTITELKDCDVSSLTWNHASTNKDMPVHHGTRMTVNCETGFINSGGSKVYCHDGELLPVNEPPNCGLTDCANNGFAKDGVVTEPSLPVQHGTQITFHCRPGYSNYGSETGICNNGTIAQTDGFPKCYADCKQEDNDMEIDNVMTKPPLPVPHGTRMTYNCRPGYSNFGGKTGFCNNGTVSLKDSSPQCYENCEEDDLPQHLTTESSFPVTHSTTLSVSCPAGYSISGGSEVMCENGRIVTASGNLPDCREHCKEVPVQWGGVNITAPVTHNTVVKIHCKKSRHINFGSDKATCINGTFETLRSPHCFKQARAQGTAMRLM
ncbi:hypothetical protein ACHWQZ_G014389 [Mnemiopsis leidyi]